MSLTVQKLVEPKVSPQVGAQNILDVEAVQARLNHKISEAVQSIVADSARRMDFGNDHKLLERGIFYPQEYFKALQATGNVARLRYLLQRDAFYNGYLNPKFFTLAEKADGPSGKMALNFVLRQGADSVAALESIRTGLSLIGCGEVCQLAQYEAVLDLIGPEKFRALFSADTTTSSRLVAEEESLTAPI